MKRIPRSVLLGAALGLMAAGLTFHLVAASGVTARSGRLVVVRKDFEPRLEEIRGDAWTVPGARPRRLAAPASAPLLGTDAPVAARSPGGRFLVYNSFRWRRAIDRVRSYLEQGIDTGDALGTPQLRVRDVDRGEEATLEPGSQSLAWRDDGALAYAVGSPPDYRANVPFLTNVVVRASPGGDPVSWAAGPARYTVLAWAGRTLLVARGEPGATSDLVAFDGPERSRVLAAAATFLAASPDGTRVLVARSLSDTPTPRIDLVRVADGQTEATMFLADARDPVTREPTAWVSPPAAWERDRVLLASSTGLVLLRVDESIEVEQVLHLDVASKPNGQLLEPRVAAGDDRTILAWSAVPGTAPIRAAQLACDRFALSCERGPALSPEVAPRPVYDPSGGRR